MSAPLLDLYASLPEADRLRVLLVAVEDFTQEAGQNRLREVLLEAVQTMHISMLAVFPYQPDSSETEIRNALTGIVVLGDQVQLARMKGPLTANWARHAHSHGSDVQMLEMMLKSISPANAASLQRMVEHCLRPQVQVRARRRI